MSRGVKISLSYSSGVLGMINNLPDADQTCYVEALCAAATLAADRGPSCI